mmetsp:Transcript_22214/g.46329  ORF Transcript_22214/g.46329 Transcript_22214/m.46329 type:complete len:99 (+) Transcript_22214:52-348(+)
MSLHDEHGWVWTENFDGSNCLWMEVRAEFHVFFAEERQPAVTQISALSMKRPRTGLGLRAMDESHEHNEGEQDGDQRSTVSRRSVETVQVSNVSQCKK